MEICRYWRLVCIVLMAAAACGPAQPGPADDLVMVDTATGVAALDPASGRVVFTAPRGMAAPDWSRYFTSTSDGAVTRLAVLDPGSGATRASMPVAGDWTVAAVSTSGRLVALAPPRQGDAHSWLPAGRDRTALVVVDAAGGSPPQRFDLAGNFEPEAFSSDDRRLFLLEYLPSLTPDRYRVRQLDLVAGETSPIQTRTKLANEEEMRGTGRMQVLAPDRRTLYTLYTRQPDHVHARDMVQSGGTGQPRGDVHAFVHVLSLAEGWAYCLDLPLPFGMGPATAHALALSPDGRRLYAADRSTGSLAVADTETLQLLQTAPKQVRVDQTPGLGAAAAVQVGRRTLFFGGGSEVVSVDATTLAPEQRWAVEGPITGIGIGRDGRRLYVGLADRVVVLDVASGRELGAVAAPGLAGIQYVGRSPALRT